MKTRPVNGQTYALDYDAEGRMVSASGGTYSAQFKYDGDGKRTRPPPLRGTFAQYTVGAPKCDHETSA